MPERFKHLPVRDFPDVTANFEQLMGLLQPPVVSSLPAVAVDGQEIFYQNATMAEAGVVWHLKYRAASTSAHKWEFVGGAALYAEAPGLVTTTSAAYTALSEGPSVTVPIAGDYEIGVQARILTRGAYYAIASPKIGAEATDANGIELYASAETKDTAYRSFKANGLAAASIELQYRVTVAGKEGFFDDRALWIRPVRVG